MVKTIIFAALLFAAAAVLIAGIINGVILTVFHIRRGATAHAASRTKKSGIVLAAVCALCAVFVWFTQLAASTPAIRDESGKIIPGSIAELRRVTLNGRKEWVSIRGNSQDNPVLLFLAGGPGGSQMAAVRHDLSELEKHFVVVNWDQPGAAKSYGAAKNIMPETYIEDGYTLTQYLLDRFGQEKIYLVGESWGSALGIFLIDRAPDLYHAFVGTGQMIDFVETEITDYELALEIARERGDTEKIDKLTTNGPPPYYGKDVTWKSAEYLNYLSSYMARNPAIQNGGYNTFRDLFSDEYGMIDKINYLRGIVNTFNHVYPLLYAIDMRTDYTNFDVPVYFFLGRHDVNAPTSLVEEYLEKLNAPQKEIVWFEHSGHNPWINESSIFVSELLRLSAMPADISNKSASINPQVNPGTGITTENTTWNGKDSVMQTAEIDLNGDGLYEKIKAYFTNEGLSVGGEPSVGYYDTCEIVITNAGGEGKTHAQTWFYERMVPQLNIADFDTRDGLIQFYLYGNGPSADPYTQIFSFDGARIITNIGFPGGIVNYDGLSGIYTAGNLNSYYDLNNGLTPLPKENIVGTEIRRDFNVLLVTKPGNGYTAAILSTYYENDLELYIGDFKDDFICLVSANTPLTVLDIEFSSAPWSGSDDLYYVPWLKVRTPDDTEGWFCVVYGD
jgi:pimeloyl-ACP methyl ester carboxylesterase